MCLALTHTANAENSTRESSLRALFDPIVKEEMKSSWEANWKTWFVTEDRKIDLHAAIRDERTPGKLKVEFEFRHGECVGLRKGKTNYNTI